MPLGPWGELAPLGFKEPEALSCLASLDMQPWRTSKLLSPYFVVKEHPGVFSRFRADCVRPGQLEAWGALALGGSWRLPGLAGPVTLGGSGSGGFPLGPGFWGPGLLGGFSRISSVEWD